MTKSQSSRMSERGSPLMDTLTPQEKNTIKDVLIDLEKELRALITSLDPATATVELDQGQQGRLSRIDAMQSQKMAIAQKRRAEQRLERVSHILTTVNDPDFGCCGDCEEPIAINRLMARPDSVLCVSCAEQRRG